MKKIRGILIDTKDGISSVKIEYNTYEDIARLLKCKWITCVRRIIGGHAIDVYCDEEALLKPLREPAIITRNSERKIIETLYGNCFLCLHNRKGEIKNLPLSWHESIFLAQANVATTNKNYQVLTAFM